MKNANLKALLDNLRNATEFLNSTKEDAASDFNGTGRAALEWVQTAALELGNALIALHEAVEYLDENSLNQIAAGSKLHLLMRGALDAVAVKPAEQLETVGDDHE
ncbi:TPA: hypothetical protein ACWMLF_004696 [Pseudomonas aeruginosa]